jgi:starch synthase
MKIAMISYEVYPFAKVGGLADVIGSLPKYLIGKSQESKNSEIEIDIFMPYHHIVRANARKFGFTIEKSGASFGIQFMQTNEKVQLYRSVLPGTKINVYLIGNEHFYSCEEVYGYPDQGEQSVFFNAGTMEAIRKLGVKYDVIHSNDWQTGLIPVYIKTLFRDDPLFKDVLTVYTIHNLGYQGKFPSMYLNMAGLPHYLFNVDALEFYGEINFMKGGILFSDIINTVSPRYAQEIQTKLFGEKLEGVLNIRSDCLYGILNGIDYDVFDPSKTNLVPHAFTATDLSGKAKNKRLLQEQLGLRTNPDTPIFGLISRLVSQKGLDILSKIIPFFLMQDVQFVVLGTGDKEYETLIRDMASLYPEKVSANLKFDLDLANLIYAGADMFLMPSKYEPCGLGQLFSLRFGTIPIVHYVGGLADTVSEFDENNLMGNGFGFSEYRESELLLSIFRALYFYKRKDSWNALIQNAMSGDFSWERSAAEYRYIYSEGLNNKRTL